MSPLKPLSDGQRKVLEVLRAAGARGVTTSELLDSPVGSRYSARIGELRKMPGCQIRTECVRAGSYRFTLLSEPSVETSRPPVEEPAGTPGGPEEERGGGPGAGRPVVLSAGEVERARGTSQGRHNGPRATRPLSLRDELALFNGDGDKQKPMAHYEDL